MRDLRLYELLFGLFIIGLIILCGAVMLKAAWPDTDCLIYGIDFNGKNEPFGLFC